MAYLKANFAQATLDGVLSAGAAQVTVNAGHSLPEDFGLTFQLVIWDNSTYLDPADDPDVEIVSAAYNASNVYDITRAQEGTADVGHASADKAAVHFTAAQADEYYTAGDAASLGSLSLSSSPLTMTGDARVTVDLFVTASGLKAPGSNPATYVEHGISGAWQFANQAIVGNQEIVFGRLKLPTQMDKSVAPVFKIGWSSDGISPGICEWQLEYLYVGPNEDTTANAQETLATTTDGVASSTSNGLNITAFSGVDLPSATDQAMFFRIKRLSAVGNDTIAGTVELIGLLFTHTRNKQGTAV